MYDFEHVSALGGRLLHRGNHPISTIVSSERHQYQPSLCFTCYIHIHSLYTQAIGMQTLPVFFFLKKTFFRVRYKELLVPFWNRTTSCSRLGGKLLGMRVNLSPKRDCGSKSVKLCEKNCHTRYVARIFGRISLKKWLTSLLPQPKKPDLTLRKLKSCATRRSKPWLRNLSKNWQNTHTDDTLAILDRSPPVSHEYSHNLSKKVLPLGRVP